MKSSSATWVKLAIAIVTMAMGLVIFKLTLAWPDTIFMSPFGSFVSVIAIAVALYYAVLWVLRRRFEHLSVK